jgi:hypothetical protein
MQAIIAAISIGLGIGLMAGHIKWDEVKQRTEDLASVAGSVVTLVGGAALALNSQSVPLTPVGAKKEDESGAEEGARE